MFELLGITLFFAALLAINSLTTFMVEGLCRITRPLLRTCSNQLQARILFTARILPFTVSIFLLVLLLAPAYIEYEPRQTSERISFKLALLATLSAAGVILAIWRGLSSWRATRNLTRYWLSNAQSVKVEGISIPSYRFRHAFPVIAVVGALRPRLFIAEQVVESLSQKELAAAIAHERAHLATRDNLKRGILRACRHMLGIVPGGRYLDVAWAEAAEAAADERASHQSRNVALDLASALVKVARLVPLGATPAMPPGSFLIDGTDHAGISSRVGKLIQLSAATDHVQLQPRYSGLYFATFAFVFSIMLMFISTTPLLLVVHSFIENVVALLK